MWSNTPWMPACPRWPAGGRAWGGWILRGWQVQLRDRRVQPAAVFQVRRLDLRAGDLSTAPGRTGTVDLGLDLRPRGRVEVRGQLAVVPAHADLTVQLRDLEVPAAQPYVGLRADLLLTGGALSGSGRLRLDTEGRARRLSFTGDLDLERLSASHGRTREPLVSWRSLHLGGLSVATAPPGLTLAEVQLSDPVGRLVRLSDGRLNLTTVLRRLEPPAPGPPRARRLEIGRIVVRGGRLQFIDRQIRPGSGIRSAASTRRSPACPPAPAPRPRWSCGPRSTARAGWGFPVA